jgi:hypothetical protein
LHSDDDKIKNESGKVCSTHGEAEECVIILVRKLKTSDHSEEVSVNGRIIFKWVLKKWGEGCGLDYSSSIKSDNFFTS